MQDVPVRKPFITLNRTAASRAACWFLARQRRRYGSSSDPLFRKIFAAGKRLAALVQ
jgi:hypothetical protein